MPSLPTVLLVDDDPQDTLLFRYAFGESSLWAQLRVVTDGHYAIQYLKGYGEFMDREKYPLPGIVLLDLHLPRIGGMAVLRWIRKQSWLTGLPVVMFADSNQGGSIREALDSGADTYVVKDHEMQEMIGLLQQMSLGWQLPDARTNNARV